MLVILILCLLLKKKIIIKILIKTLYFVVKMILINCPAIEIVCLNGLTDSLNVISPVKPARLSPDKQDFAFLICIVWVETIHVEIGRETSKRLILHDAFAPFLA